jgi:hypothetical protein
MTGDRIFYQHPYNFHTQLWLTSFSWQQIYLSEQKLGAVKTLQKELPNLQAERQILQGNK